MIYFADQLIGFYIMATLAFNELNGFTIALNECAIEKSIKLSQVFSNVFQLLVNGCFLTFTNSMKIYLDDFPYKN